MNSPRLRSYHNPENVDESRVPKGWRFLYADEAALVQHRPCRAWIDNEVLFDEWSGYFGKNTGITYIVPVA
jgi:hypothetical protein